MKRWVVLGSVGVALTAQAAWAQGSTHDSAARAFGAARVLLDAGNCRDGLPKLEESLAYEPSVGAYLSMADCYEQVDLLATWKQLKAAQALASEKKDSR